MKLLTFLVASVLVLRVTSQEELDQHVLNNERTGGHADDLFQEALTYLERLPPFDENIYAIPPLIAKNVLEDRIGENSFTNLRGKGLSYLTGRKSNNDETQIPPEQIEEMHLLGVELLEQSAAMGSHDALYTLAEMNFYGNYSTPKNAKLAFHYYKELASMGNSSAMFMTGLCYSTGVFGQIPVDQARASLYYSMAAEQGDVRAAMAMGSRFRLGIASDENAGKSAYYYQKAASKSAEYLNDGTLGGRHLPSSQNWVVTDAEGGLYGKGASVLSSGELAKTEKFDFDGPETANNLEYMHFQADESNDVICQYQLAKLYLFGTRKINVDAPRGFNYALNCASRFWDQDGNYRLPVSTLSDEEKIVASRCAKLVGISYLRKDGVPEVDTEAGFTWLSRATQFTNDPHALAFLAEMYLNGISPATKDLDKATQLCNRGVNYNDAKIYRALAQIGKEKGDVGMERENLMSAAERGDLRSMFYVGNQLLAAGNQLKAMKYFRAVSEAAEDFHSPLRWAQESFKTQKWDNSLLGFLIAAEQGYLSAIINTAYLLDFKHGAISFFGSEALKSPDHQKLKTALVYWTRAAMHENEDCIVKMGDYYYYGYGLDAPEPVHAGSIYLRASHLNAQAMFNLGWMHEYGVGLDQDFGLAKRYYDFAKNTKEAYLPAILALIRLHIKNWWVFSTGGSIKMITSGRKELSRPLSEKLKAFWDRWTQIEFSDGDFEDWEYENSFIVVEDEYVDLVVLVIMLTAFFGIGLFALRGRINRFFNRQPANGPQEPQVGPINNDIVAQEQLAEMIDEDFNNQENNENLDGQEMDEGIHGVDENAQHARAAAQGDNNIDLQINNERQPLLPEEILGRELFRPNI